MSKSKNLKIPYGITPNNLLYNKEISLTAKGLFAFIQSKSEDFEITPQLIQAQFKEPLEVILSGLKELEDFGYLGKESINNQKV